MQTETTIARITIRQLLTLRSGLVVLLFASLPVLLAALSHLRPDAPPLEIAIGIYVDLLIPVVLPIVALVLGTGAFGAEMEDGTIAYLLTKPVPRWRITVAKLVTTAVLAAAVTSGAALAAGLVAFRGLDSFRVVMGFALAIGIGAILYTTLFLALRFFVRRAIIVGLVYVVGWERMAVSNFPGVRNFSVSQYVHAIADGIATAGAELYDASVALATAWQMSAALLAVGTLIAILRVQSFELSGVE